MNRSFFSLVAKGRGVVVCALLGAATPAFAQTPTPVPAEDTMARVLEDTYRNNPTLLAGRAQLRAAGENVAQARANGLPTVTATGTANYNTTLDDNFDVTRLDENSNQSARLNATLPLYDGGRSAAATASAQAGVRGARANLSNTEQNILLNAATAYVDVLRDQEIVALSIQSARAFQGQLEAARARFELGEVTRTDVAQAEASLANARAIIVQSRGAARASAQNFFAVVGRPPGRLAAPPRLPLVPNSLELASRLAHANHPSIGAARASEAAAKQDLLQQYAQLGPTVELGGSVTHNSNVLGRAQSNTVVGLSLSINAPIYRGGLLNSQVRQAKAVLEQRRAETQAAIRAVQADVATAWTNLLTARAAIVANREQIRATEIAYEGVQVEIEVGARSTSDLLQAQRNLLDARIALVRAQRDMHASVYTLTTAISRMNPEALGVGVSYSLRAAVEPEPQLRFYQPLGGTQWRFPWRRLGLTPPRLPSPQPASAPRPGAAHAPTFESSGG